MEYAASRADKKRAYDKKRGAEKRDELREKGRAYYQANKDRILQGCREYRQRNLGRTRARYATTPRIRVDSSMGNGVRDSLNKCRAGVQSKSRKRWERLVGYDLADLMQHLEPMFTDGMTWDNYGEWHIDHIVPKSWFDYDSPDELAFMAAWSLENLQPLWAEDNMRKSNRWSG